MKDGTKVVYICGDWLLREEVAVDVSMSKVSSDYLEALQEYINLLCHERDSIPKTRGKSRNPFCHCVWQILNNTFDVGEALS